MAKIKIALLLFFVLGTGVLCFAQVTPPLSQIERSQELIDREEDLRKKIEEPRKQYFEEIVLEGSTKLTEDEVNEIISPYQKKWLDKEDIQQIIELIKEAYRSKGCADGLLEISYQIKEKRLIIEIKESTQ